MKGRKKLICNIIILVLLFQMILPIAGNISLAWNDYDAETDNNFLKEYSSEGFKYNIYKDFSAKLIKYTGNNKMKTLNVPNIVQEYNGKLYSVRVIGESAFYNGNYETVNIPQNITRIGKHAFSYCGIKTLNFNENSNLQVIGDYAFYNNCIENIKIGKKVKFINPMAFAYNKCSSTIDLTDADNTINIETNAFVKNNKYFTEFKVRSDSKVCDKVEYICNQMKKVFGYSNYQITKVTTTTPQNTGKTTTTSISVIETTTDIDENPGTLSFGNVDKKSKDTVGPEFTSTPNVDLYGNLVLYCSDEKCNDGAEPSGLKAFKFNWDNNYVPNSWSVFDSEKIYKNIGKLLPYSNLKKYIGNVNIRRKKYNNCLG